MSEEQWPTLPDGFYYDKSNGNLCCFLHIENKRYYGPVCKHVEVTEVGYDSFQGGWGVALEWEDYAGKKQRMPIFLSKIQYNREWTRTLASKGLSIYTGMQKAFKQFVILSCEKLAAEKYKKGSGDEDNAK